MKPLHPFVIDALPPGRALDALVATWFFGACSAEGIDGEGIPAYSTDHTAARMLLHQLETSGWHVWIDLTGVRCALQGKEPRQPEGYGETIPLALCRAALKSMIPCEHLGVEPPPVPALALPDSVA